MKTGDTFEYTLSTSGVLLSMFIAHFLLSGLLFLSSEMGITSWLMISPSVLLSLAGLLYLYFVARARCDHWYPRQTVVGVTVFLLGVGSGYGVFFTQADMDAYAIASSLPALRVWVTIMATTMLLGVGLSTICFFVWFGLWFDAQESWRYYRKYNRMSGI
jgi:hypothetical protein